MALRPTCDVYGTAHDVKLYRVTIEEICRDTGEILNKSIKPPVDLCPRAYDRLKKKIKGGITPPTERKKKGETT